MLTPEPDGSATGNEAAWRTQEERYANEAWVRTNRAHRRTTAERHLAARHGDWASQSIGESLYVRTLWVLMWKGNDPLGSKINKRSQVEAELGISMGEAGEAWRTISIAQRWVAIKENLAPHVLVIPFGMWEILTEWDLNDVILPRRKLRI